MGLVGKSFMAAKSAAGMTLGLSRATGHVGMSLNYAVRALATRHQSVALRWQRMSIVARGTDWAALQEVLIEDEYGALRPYLARKSPPTVLDIGANIGTFALFVFSVAPSAAVHSFEPATDTFAVLQSNCEQNPACCWQAYQAAGWHQDGTITFATGAASTAGRVSLEGGDETVPTLSLPSILAKAGGHADVAKIDIEGAEEALLADNAEHLAHIETIVVELHPGRCDTERVTRALRETYGELYAIPGRRSSKPLLLATRAPHRPDLPVYRD